MNCGLYASLPNGTMGERIIDFGALSCATVGAVDSAPFSLTLTRGLYWIGGVMRGSVNPGPSVRAFQGLNVLGTAADPSSGNQQNGWSAATPGPNLVLPSTFAGVGHTVVQNIPMILLRRSNP
jgi:hypothetical protein